jgi:hypothetical protein
MDREVRLSTGIFQPPRPDQRIIKLQTNIKNELTLYRSHVRKKRLFVRPIFYKNIDELKAALSQESDEIL